MTVSRHFAKKGDVPFGGAEQNGHGLMPRFGDGHNLLVTGSTHDEQGFRKTSDPEVHNQLVRRLAKKIEDARPFLEDYVASGPKSAEWGIISFGSTSRSVEEFLVDYSDNGIRTLRLRTVWPFPDEAVTEFGKTVDKILVPELNLGQMVREVTRTAGRHAEITPINKIGGGLMITPNEIMSVIKSKR
jgi:2-oxoglutarate ferredoxin oxidoreductase subunit alpha